MNLISNITIIILYYNLVNVLCITFYMLIQAPQ